MLVGLLGLVAVPLALGLSASPAGAHGGDAEFAVETAEPQPDGSVHYVVRVTWSDDGHAASDATVTATAVDGADVAQTPVPMTAGDDDGRYEATVTFPSAGAWTIRFAAIDPDGTFEQAQEVAEPAATTTTAADSTTTVGDDTTTSLATDDTENASATQSSDDDSSSSAGLIIGIVIALVVLAVVGYLVWRSRQHGGPSGEAAPSESA